MTVVDPWKKIMPPLREVQMTRENTALVVMTMQKMWVHPDYGTLKAGRELGMHEEMDYYAGAVAQALEQIRFLVDAFRERKYEVVHVAVESMTKDGRDKVAYHKDRSGYTKGQPGNEFIDEMLPLEDELVFRKTSCSVFNSTSMRQVLQNIGIENLVLTGGVTNSSVGACILDGADLGFHMFLAEDATFCLTPELQQASLEILAFFTRIRTAREIVSGMG